jgi:hypothetical protein
LYALLTTDVLKLVLPFRLAFVPGNRNDTRLLLPAGIYLMMLLGNAIMASVL